MNFYHQPVLLNETVNMLNINPNGTYVDGTLGGAGHSYEICKRLQNGRLIGIDQDIEAVKSAQEKLESFKDKIIIVNDNFINIPQILDRYDIDKVDGILLDIGVSSHQLEQEDRGFTYQVNASLDMRMNKDLQLTAQDVVNTYSESKLSKIIYEYGEERWAKRIAKQIVKYRSDKSIESTDELVEIIKRAIPSSKRRKGPHPAKRTFQAIRIEVNDELNVLKNTINNCISRLKQNGRICIITFHSLEDRIVKKSFNYLSNPCTCPSQFPVCVCNKVSVLKVITKKPITSSEQELEENHRARSAKLRVAEKI